MNMGTRSLIGVQTGDGVRAVYCHWDGYIEGVGNTLKEFYNAPHRVEELISLGGMSSLREYLPSEKIKDIVKAKSVDAYGWPEEVTQPYHLWRGDSLDIDWFTLSMYFDKESDIMGSEFRYLFDGKQWIAFDVYANKLQVL